MSVQLRRGIALAAVVIAGSLLVSCSKEEPEPVPKPEGIDLEAAAEIGASGNGLWILDGVSAAGRVIDAMRAADGGTMTASVHEMIPVEQGDPLPGRNISVVSSTDGTNLQASFVVGDQTGELVIIGNDVWVKGNGAFTERIGAGDGTDEFVCMARGSTSIAEFETLAKPAEFLRSTLSGLEIGTLSPTEAEPDLQSLVLGVSAAPIGYVTVAAQGPPLPHQISAFDVTGSVEAQFTWGDVSEIQAPDGDASGCG
ncbi:hypothetical protein [Leucobacter denitrificans]|uniref:LppX_LprAFG lipoprotein n=1 Tax=Leucobacter denitrificans TaxID=683042 RepID=A0A7G9S4R7_9MICO|nr:hypothetical protein [Leucobacter denitrificans]QNN62842.1 hypothetical protein H9L06_00075 [Leucobacter denitrificans]